MRYSRCLALAVCCLVFHATTAHGVELLFDFEGDSGTTVTDKLTDDGATNGTIYQNVNPADASPTMFGTQSAFFDLPVVLPTLSVIKVPDTIFPANFSMTLAGFANSDPSIQRLSRLFTTFSGSGATTNQLLFDFSTAPADMYIRGIVDGVALRTPAGSPPAGLGTPGYHHYAMTVDAGQVKLYFDGVNVITSAASLPAGYDYVNEIQIGEDRSGAVNEQLVGNLDEVLILRRSLPAADIAQLASGMSVSSVVTPIAEERSIYLDFEGDSGTTLSDKFALDGSQNGLAQVAVSVDSNPAHARLGDSSARFDLPPPNIVQHSVVRTGPIGALGPQFTLSATINIPIGGQPSGNIARLLSTYSGAGATTGRLLFDVNPNAVVGGTGTAALGVRLILPDGTTTSVDVGPALNANQTITATYDLGVVKLYLNGVEIKSMEFAPNIISLGNSQVSIGEDLAGAVNEQFVGNIDDVLILSRALTPEQVANLHTMGAAAVVASLPDPVIYGDYNEDNSVDAADYVVWRKNFGLAGPGLAGDGNGDGAVNNKDYILWRYYFGSTIPPVGGGALGSIPEPSTTLLLSIVASIAAFARTQRSSTKVVFVG